MTAKNLIRQGGVAAALLAIFILIAGCGGSDSDQTGETGETGGTNVSQEAQVAVQTADERQVNDAANTVQDAVNAVHDTAKALANDAANTAADAMANTEPAVDTQSQPSGYHSSDRTAPRDDPAAAKPGDGHSGAGAKAEALQTPDLPDPAGRKTAPKTELVDIAGHKMTLDSFGGQAVLVVFWATWCPPCKAEIPHLVHLQDKYGESGLKILGLSLDQKGLPEVKRFLKTKREINYTIVPNGIQAARAFGKVNSIPTTILLDKKGRILKRFVGLRPPEELEGWVVAAMKEQV